MAASAERLLGDLHALASLTATERGAQRVAWTDTWARAREWERELLGELPVSVEVDEAGNLWATLPGERPETLVLGSHLDSVPDGGWLDGALGVLGALEVLRGIAAAGTPPLTVKLVDWADEEGARFGLSLMGSSAVTGKLDPSFVAGLRDAGGVGTEEALAAHGVSVARMPEAEGRLDDAVAYLELHIEQGPVLEARDLSLAVVTGTYGVERWAVRFQGQAAHSGSTPMDLRHDAVAGAARLALEVREIAARQGGVGTVGRIDAEPGIVTAVAGVATALVDQRHAEARGLATVHGEAREASGRIADEEGLSVEWSPLFRIHPIPFDPGLIDAGAAVVGALQGEEVRLPSGPLHDAAHVADSGVPTVMLFVRSERGLSHTREEDTDEADLALAVEALDRLASEVLAGGGVVGAPGG
ncbi:MAG TPA: Zn-dependent hydrolase [Solirubrobacteraceae bacterium]|jgi:N-carbamoyl-L-amino-acid hydrolase|nr:Zn-dependent hydrolase [Solirubrobacteraceae bacterium]